MRLKKMKWFKHDTDANMNRKMKKLYMKYGLEGWGLYWYCLELIAGDTNQHCLNFELKHDSEILAHNLHMSRDKLEDMIRHMVEIQLFENSHGRIMCLKLLKRMDQYQTGNAEFRAKIKQAKTDNNYSNSHDSIMTESCVSHELDIDIDIDKIKDNTLNRVSSEKVFSGRESEKNNSNSEKTKIPNCPHEKIASLYNQILPELPNCKRITETRRRQLQSRWRENPKRQNLEYWEKYFSYVSTSDFLMGKTKDFKANFDWLIKPTNFQKVIEGNYENRD